MVNFINPVRDDKIYQIGELATHKGKCGRIEDVWQGDDGKLYIELAGPDFDGQTNTFPDDKIIMGGTPTQYPPTLHYLSVPKGYEIKNLEKPDLFVPPGWAVYHANDGVYVGWGMPDRRTAEIFAFAFDAGIGFLGGKF